MDALMIAAAGLTAQDLALTTLDNDLANTDSAGFLALVSRTAAWPTAPVARTGQAVVAPALALGAAAVTTWDAAPGAVVETGRPLDAALPDGAFFAVQTPQGVAYTRAGAFRVSPAGWLVDAGGAPVLATTGAPIRVPPGAAVAIGSDGTVTADGQPVAVLGRWRLAGGIQARGQGRYTGVAVPDAGPVVPGALVLSNVDRTATLADLAAAAARAAALAQAWRIAGQTRQQAAGLGALS